MIPFANSIQQPPHKTDDTTTQFLSSLPTTLFLKHFTYIFLKAKNVLVYVCMYKNRISKIK